MSSGIEGIGEIAPVVAAAAGAVVIGSAVVGAAAVLGTGWLAWKSGELLVKGIVSTHDLVERRVYENKVRAETEAMQKRIAADAAYMQMRDLCRQTIEELKKDANISAEEKKRLISQAEQLLGNQTPGETDAIRAAATQGYMKLQSILLEKDKSVSRHITSSDNRAAAQVLRDIGQALASLKVQTQRLKDVRAADPDVLERLNLEERRDAVVGRILNALGYVEEIEGVYGLGKANNNTVKVCFNGTEHLIEKLYAPAISLKELRSGIGKLEECIRIFDSQLSSILDSQKKMYTLYEVYRDMAEAFGEPIRPISSFLSCVDLEKAMEEMDARTARAEECAEMLRALGEEAYLCMAMDTELQNLGFNVCGMPDLGSNTPENLEINGVVMENVYRWRESDISQLYRMSEQCSLQTIIHEDGSVSMQMIAEEGDTEDIRAFQKLHCDQLKQLAERLRKNWFIQLDDRETLSSEEILTEKSWRDRIVSGTGETAAIVVDERTDLGDQTPKQQEQKLP